MGLINIKEIERLIKNHQNEISKLEQLLSLSASFAGSKQKRSVAAAKPVRAKKAKRAKRGSVTTSILNLLAAASKPMAAGDIRTVLVDKDVVEKGSSTVYAMLSQMSKKGIVKKAKTANGIVYTTAPSRK
ncbi:MAG: BlaI/MecI/CopY family transcriptional regulator [Nitrospinota bacterium]|nr:BlaI/MecI/CopY family transcriptional regulator [Nitrospinota bacterium]